METNPVAANFLAFSVTHLKGQQAKIASCCDKLSEAQLQHRAGDYENSIVNLLLHLEGNIRQWILHGVDNQPDIRQRDDEFALMLSIHQRRSPRPPQRLPQILASALSLSNP